MKRKSKDVESEDDDNSVLSDDLDASDIGEIEGASTNGAESGRRPDAKIQKLNKGELYKPPTRDELTHLKETENLFQSNLFRLQIEELLKEVKLKDKRRKQLDQFLESLKIVICKASAGKEHQVGQVKWLAKKGASVPLIGIHPPGDTNFHFLTPKSAEVVGSHVFSSNLRPHANADIAVCMPKECFREKDYLNLRYTHKRALYLACLSTHLKKSTKLIQTVKFAYHHSNHIRPILVVQPKGEHVSVRVHVHPERQSFRLHRFHPTKNNLRTAWYEKDSEHSNTDAVCDPATPHYNSSVLQDMLISEHTRYLHSLLIEAPGLQDGIILLKVWLHQRQLDVGRGAFSGFLLSMYVALLVSRRKLNTLMSSYQVMRNTMMQLAEGDWCEGGAFLSPPCNPDTHCPTMADMRGAFKYVLIDPSGHLNLASHLCPLVVKRLQYEARLACFYLENPGIDSFDVLFMKFMPFELTFDLQLRVSNIQDLASRLRANPKNSHEFMDNCEDFTRVAADQMVKLLQQALDKRLKLLALQPQPDAMWDIDDPPPPMQDTLTLGLLLDTEHSSGVLDKGPAADSPEAAEFRSFWGDHSELRRFQDGSICEAVLWSAKTTAARRYICTKICRHILQSHMDVDKSSVCVIGPQLDSLLQLPQRSRREAVPYGTGEEQISSIGGAVDSLMRQLRSLRDLPLTISSIQGASPAARHAEVFPAMPAVDVESDDKDRRRAVPTESRTPHYTASHKVLIILEASGKWPEDREAIRRVKAAFHLKLGELMSTQCGLCAQTYPTHVLVLKAGYVFRLEVCYLKEMSLARMVRATDGKIKSQHTAEAEHLHCSLVIEPTLTSALQGVGQRFPGYSSTVRMVLRWVGAQLLLHPHTPPQALELMVASLFLNPAPYSHPSTPIVAFLRWLHLMSTHDWHQHPLIVNLSGVLTKEELSEIEANFRRDRATLPLMFIATPYDKKSAAWTKNAPSAPILHRLALVAKESFNLLQQNLLVIHETDVDMMQVFRPSMALYDAVIHLDESHLPRAHLAVDLSSSTYIPATHQLGDEEPSVMPVVDYDPAALLLQELKTSYDNMALFFHDPYGGRAIGVLWKPAALEPQSFKVSHINGRMPEASDGDDGIHIVSNTAAILEDFKIIGHGIVKSIDVKTFDNIR